MFLAIDSVFDQSSVAVITHDFKVVTCDTQTGRRLQTQQILPMIQAALKEANLSLSQLDALIFNRGPGGFSGIRINTAVVQALSIAQDIPCVGVSSLAAVAQEAYERHGVQHVYTAIDARMQQVYFGEYELFKPGNMGSEVTVSGLPNIMTGASFRTNDASAGNKANRDNNSNQRNNNERLVEYDTVTSNTLPIVGNGAQLLQALPNQLVLPEISPDAVTIARLGVVQYLQVGGVPAQQALPVYLRNNAWKTLKEQKEYRQSL